MCLFSAYHYPTLQVQFASAGETWEELREAEKDQAKERLKSLRYEKYGAQSHYELFLNP